MKVVYTPGALRDLSEIVGYLKQNNPTIVHRVEARFASFLRGSVAGRKARKRFRHDLEFEQSPLVRYPYRILSSRRWDG
jgi:plasmid stabilization system protein ParE